MGRRNAPERSTMRIIVVGAGKVGTSLTAQLIREHRVTVIDQEPKLIENIINVYDVMGVCGNGASYEVQKEAEVGTADLLIATTSSDETNILACLAAKRMGVTKTVAEVENIDYISMAESLDIGTVINKKMIAASHIYQMMLDADVSNVKCLTFANADVAEFTVKNGSRITKCAVKDAGLPKGATIGGLIRNGEGILVTGNTVIQPNDHVVVFCLGMMIKKIEKFFN